jgi:hypothetical protein
MIRQMQESYSLSDDVYRDEIMLTIVVVGGSGDLAKKKIFPALFALYYQGLLPAHIQIVGYARSKASDDEFRQKIYGTLGCRIDAGSVLERKRVLAGSSFVFLFCMPKCSARIRIQTLLYAKMHTVVFPKEGQMRLAGQASRSNKSEIFWTSDRRNNVFSDLEGYLRKLA